MKKPRESGDPPDSAEASGKSRKLRRTARGHRAISEAYLLPPAASDGWSLLSNDGLRDEVLNAFKNLNLTISPADEIELVVRTHVKRVEMYLALHLESEYRGSHTYEDSTLQALIKSAERFQHAVMALAGDKRLRVAFDSAVLQNAPFIAALLLNTLGDAPTREALIAQRNLDALRGRPFAEIVAISLGTLIGSLKKLSNHLKKSSRIANPSHYKFVDDAARVWYVTTGCAPTHSRTTDVRTTNRRKSNPSPSRLFQPFIEAIAPEIKPETVRSVLEGFAARIRVHPPQKWPPNHPRILELLGQ